MFSNLERGLPSGVAGERWGGSWQMGSGQQINLLQDSWLCNHPITCLPIPISDAISLDEATVSSLLDKYGMCPSLFRRTFGQELANNIQGIPIPSHHKQDLVRKGLAVDNEENTFCEHPKRTHPN